MPVLVISEKDDAAKRIARILSGGKAKSTKHGKIRSYGFERDGNRHDVVGLKGHLVELDYPTEFRSWYKTELKDLIWADATKKVAKGKRDIQTALKKLADGADRIVVATDYDREGELIGVEALDVIEKIRGDAPVFRARFSSLTEKAIEKAFASLVEVDYHLAAAAESRQHVDLAWGATLTRFISLASRARRGEFLSVGRVQSPTLALLVEKEKEIRGFTPEPYWQITAGLDGDPGFEAAHANGDFFDAKAADAAYDAVKDATTARVAAYTSKPITERAPSPFNTTEFQRQASNHLGMTAKRAMDVAESLYMDGYISYPRTDNTVYPPDEDLEELLRQISLVPEYSPLVDQLRDVRRSEPTRGKKHATDHPPIHPMDAPKPGALDEAQLKIYDLVVRRFMATLAKDAKGQSQTVELEIGPEPFRATGYRLAEPGWRAFYPFTGRKKPPLPEIQQGATLGVQAIDMAQKETQPPRRYGQAGIIAKMEELGLGTKSTRHEILERLSDRNYVKSPTTLEPTETAFAVMDSLGRYAQIVTSPEMTAELEQEMEQIAQGEKALGDVVTDSRKMLEKALAALEANRDKLGDEIRVALRKQSVVGPCPNCKKDLLVRHARKSGKRFVGCSGWPDCNQTFPLPQTGFIEPLLSQCDTCGSPEIKILKKGRRPWELCINMDCPKQVAERAEREARQAAKQEAAEAAPAQPDAEATVGE